MDADTGNRTRIAFMGYKSYTTRPTRRDSLVLVPNQIKRLFKQKAKKLTCVYGESNPGCLHERQVCYHHTNYARHKEGFVPVHMKRLSKTKAKKQGRSHRESNQEHLHGM